MFLINATRFSHCLNTSYLSIFLFFCFSGKALIYKYPSCGEMLPIKMTGLLIIPLKVPHWRNHLWIDSGVLQIPNEGDGWRIFLYWGDCKHFLSVFWCWKIWQVFLCVWLDVSKEDAWKWPCIHREPTQCVCNRLFFFYSDFTGFTLCFTYNDTLLSMYVNQC